MRSVNLKKVSKILIIALTSFLFLSACSNDEEDKSQEVPKEDSENEATESKETIDVETEDEKKSDVKEQTELKIGDTGTFDTTLGTYEMTLDAAELIGPELEGEKSTRDDLILLDITIKNTSDSPQIAEDLIFPMEVTKSLEYSGSYDHADGFKTIKEFSGEIKPGEEQSAQYLTIVDESNIYYFRKMETEITNGNSNQVTWTIEF